MAPARENATCGGDGPGPGSPPEKQPSLIDLYLIVKTVFKRSKT